MVKLQFVNGGWSWRVSGKDEPALCFSEQRGGDKGMRECMEKRERDETETERDESHTARAELNCVRLRLCLACLSVRLRLCESVEKHLEMKEQKFSFSTQSIRTSQCDRNSVPPPPDPLISCPILSQRTAYLP